MLGNINKDLLISLNSLTEYESIQTIVYCFSDIPIFFIPIFLIISWLYYSYNKKTIFISEIHLTKNLLEKENLLYILYSVVIWIFVSLLIQQVIVVDRPEEALKWIWSLILNHIPDASFPSDHATVSVAFLSGLFFAGYKKTWLYFTPFVIIMLLSRVILWVHWPFDILAWAFVWYISSYITFKYLIKFNFINKINQFIIKIMTIIKL